MIYVDSHCHLDDEVYKNDREEVLLRAKENDVKLIAAVCCITERGDADITLELMEREGIYAIFGIHPHDAKSLNDELIDYLREVMRHPKAIAIGEIGLDYYYKYSSNEEQKLAFRKQIELSLEIKKPIVVHSRQARMETLNILQEVYCKKPLSISGIMHCFSGDVEMAIECVSLGFVISFSGVITFENATKIREVVKEISIEHILSETDSPYLAPVPYRGKRNEPANVIKVVNKIAEIKKMTVREVSEAIHDNFARIYKC